MISYKNARVESKDGIDMIIIDSGTLILKNNAEEEISPN